MLRYFLISIYLVSIAYFGEGNGTPLQYSYLENSMDGEAWWAAVHGVTKSRTSSSHLAPRGKKKKSPNRGRWLCRCFPSYSTFQLQSFSAHFQSLINNILKCRLLPNLSCVIKKIILFPSLPARKGTIPQGFCS